MEVLRRAALLRTDEASSSTAVDTTLTLPQVPVAGKQRSNWLRERLVRMLQEDTDVCGALEGSMAEALVACFERTSAESFTDSAGAAVTSRVRRMAKVMGHLTAKGLVDPPLLAAMRGGLWVWNRRPKVSMDVERWHRQEEAREGVVAPAARNCVAMVGANAELAVWVRSSPYLKPVDVEAGEFTMGLLLLWEVEHGRPFPAGVNGDNRSALAASFGRRLRAQVQKEDELRGWLQVKERQCAAQPGAPAIH